MKTTGINRSPRLHDTSVIVASANVRTAIAAVLLFLITVAIWIPFGIGGNPQGDGWILKNWVDNGERLFVSNPTRILLLVPWTLAHFMSPDSFVAIHILLISMLWGKGLVLFAILRRLAGGHDGFAVLTAALSIVYPASTLLITLDEGIDRHWATFFLLVAILLLLEYWRKPRPACLAGMCAAQAVSLWTNEAILLPALAVPLLLLWIARSRSREFWRTSALWLVVPFLNAIHNAAHHVLVALLPNETTLQSHGVAILALEGGWRPMVESMLLAYRRHLADGWWRSVQSLDGTTSYLALGGAAAVLAIVVGWLFWPKNGALDRGLLWGLIIAGMIVIGLGFAPFVPTVLRFSSGHSFVVSSLGAPLVISAVAGMMCMGRGRWDAVYRGLMGVLIGVAMVGALTQHALYIRGSLAQDAILASVIEQAPGVSPLAFFAVGFNDRLDALQRAAGIHRRSNVLHHALSFLYDDPSLQAGLLNSKAYTAWGKGYRLAPDGVAEDSPSGPRSLTIPYERVLIFRVKADLTVKLLQWLPKRYRDPTGRTYDPQQMIATDTPPPRRWTIVSHRRRG